MKSQESFKRYEYKYFLSPEQTKRLMQEIETRMEGEAYGKSTICNLYYDTDDYKLIRRSLDKPIFKEKLRVRSYGRVGEEDKVFLEIKRKYKGEVYKRRASLKERQAMAFLAGQEDPAKDNQVLREIAYFKQFYKNLSPKVALYYDRNAFYEKESGLRVTLDENIRWRPDRLRLTEDDEGQLLLPEGTVLMEIKALTAIPKWMVDFLSREQIRKTAFSKYGKAYLELKENRRLEHDSI